MDDLFEYSAKQFPSEEKNEERSIYSVSELTRKIRNLLEYKIGEIWVEGEISNLRKQASGHQYFTLKDAKSQLSCVLFRGCLLYTSPSPRDATLSRMPSSA